MDGLAASEENPENIDTAWNGFANVDTWLKHVERCSHAICRIEIPGGNAQGTGFLMQPGMIITNYHVMQPVIDNSSLHNSVVIRFGFQTTSGDRGLSAGTEYELATDTDWLAASSQTEDLDFVLVRIKAASTNPANMANILLYRLTPEDYYTFIPGEPLCILQHPLGIAQQIKWGSVVRVNGDDTRVYYTTKTLKGSSGAPCFNSDMKLVALHQGNLNSNEKKGIPFPTIMTYLRQHYPEIFTKIATKQDSSVLVSVYENCHSSHSVIQFVYDIFHSEKPISGDKRLLSYERLKNASASLQEAFEQLALVRVSDISLYYRLANEQLSLQRQIGVTMTLLHNFRMEIMPSQQQSIIQRQLALTLHNLQEIDHLLILYGINLV